MGCVIISFVALILCVFDLLSPILGIVLVVGSLAWTFIGMGLYFKFGIFKFFYHDFLEWHTPDDSPGYFDGCSEHATCKYCGKDIMQDSQGNWF